ncbi:MAG: hypothetical protein IT293_17570 [Deltaproteobacteria bacterium]|nr:hypothetical protein [Deltaproteobacteria bacterium]
MQRVRVTGAPYRTLRSTNAIENLRGLVGHFVRNVGAGATARCLAAFFLEDLSVPRTT